MSNQKRGGVSQGGGGGGVFFQIVIGMIGTSAKMEPKKTEFNKKVIGIEILNK